MLSIMDKDRRWLPETVQTVAKENKGINLLVELIETHIDFNYKNGFRIQKMDERYKNNISKIVSENYLNFFCG